VIQQIVVIIEAYHFCQLLTKFYPASCCQGCGGNYWGSSVWILTQQVNYWSYILHLSNTYEQIGIHWSSVSAIYRLQESLWLS